MQTFEPNVINRLFLKQMRNLTRYDTVYVSESCDDFDSEEGIDCALDEDRMSGAEAAWMQGYLRASKL